MHTFYGKLPNKNPLICYRLYFSELALRPKPSIALLIVVPCLGTIEQFVCQSQYLSTTFL